MNLARSVVVVICFGLAEMTIIGVRPAIAQDNPGADGEKKSSIWIRAEAWLEKGHRLHEQGDTAGAIEAFSETISLWPTYAKAYLARGAMHILADDPDAALAEARSTPRSATLDAA